MLLRLKKLPITIIDTNENGWKSVTNCGSSELGREVHPL